MAFNVEVWKAQVKTKLGGWHARWVTLRNTGTAKLYPFLAATALLPLVPALQSEPVSVGVALGGVLAGVGGNLIATVIQNWKDEATATRDLEEAITHDAALREQIDTMMEKLDVVAQAKAALPEEERAWFTETLQRELEQLGNQARYEAVLTGDGAISQGSGDALGAGAVKIGGDVGRDVVTGKKRS